MRPRYAIPASSPLCEPFRGTYFVPEASVEHSYQDTVVPVKYADDELLSTLSQPSAIVVMLEQLQVGEGMRVLEIGTGTGYNAALLAELVGPSGRVTTMDIDDDLTRRARPGAATGRLRGGERPTRAMGSTAPRNGPRTTGSS